MDADARLYAVFRKHVCMYDKNCSRFCDSEITELKLTYEKMNVRGIVLIVDLFNSFSRKV